MNETMPAFFKSKFSPSETFDGRSNSRHEVLSPERAVASCSTASDLRHAVAAFSANMIRNSAKRFPKFSVTERRGCAKLNIATGCRFQNPYWGGNHKQKSDLRWRAWDDI